jgi:ubiquinone/menaquinone biosynthesis C-methylase UbiE
MSVFSKLKKVLFPASEQDPRKAYDRWASAYDTQPGNLMLDLDEAVFSSLLAKTSIQGKVVADIGCGTGRHWNKVMEKQPLHLLGFDVSPGMLAKLKEKFPAAETYELHGELLPSLPAASCDLLISTLTVAHIPAIEKALTEWNRVLKPGGEVIITDYHPLALTKGGKRTFKHEGKTIAVKNYIHTIDAIRRLTTQLGWTELRYTERVIDESVKKYYEQQQAVHLFEAYYNVPIIYGIYLKKTDGPA